MHRPVPLLLLIVLPMAQAWATSKPFAPASIEGTTSLIAEEVVELILRDPTLVVIDSRKEEEFEKGHIEGAVNLPDTDMSREDLARHVPGYDNPILFYCNGPRCLRSTNAITKALEWGYRQLYWFRGGWLEWREKKLPIAR